MELSVLQWNVLFTEKADNIIRGIEEFNADILCLQELTRNTHLNPGRDIPAELGKLGYPHNFYEAVGDLDYIPEAQGQIGNGIFSKFPLLDSRVVYVQQKTPGTNDYSLENRAYVEVVVQAEDKRLTIGTVHLSYTAEFASTKGKKAEADRLVEAIEGNKKNFIVTGDLNAEPDSYTINALENYFVSAGPDYSEKTWTTKPFSYNDFEATTLDWRLDYVFTTPDVKVLDSHIIHTTASDHLPILTTIEI